MNLKYVESIRQFNRFYLPYFRLLSQKYLNSDYTVTDARILYEIYDRHMVSATDIISAIQIDKGYLSRILKKFEKSGFIQKSVLKEDSRVSNISLTASGIALAEKLIQESDRQIDECIQGLSERDLKEISASMDRIIEILKEGTTNGNR